MNFPARFIVNFSLIIGIACGACTAATSPQSGEADPRLEAMQQELSELQAEVRQVHARQSSPWMDERRAEEIKGLIQEVLSDAETRASLLSDELTAYYDGGFIIRDEEFLLKIGGYIQFRYINNTATQDDDNEEGGFQTRRLALMFSGHIGSPRVSYFLMPTINRTNGKARFENAFVKFKIDDAWNVTAGQFKAPFGREWLVSARFQPMVERSYINALFTSLYVQGVKATRQGEDTRLYLALHNGTWGWNTDFDADNTDYALGARGEWKVCGDWSQFKDQVGWSGDDLGLMLGSALQYDSGETGGVTNTPDILKYTADINLESEGWNIFAAFTGRHIESNGSASIIEADQWGAVLQGGIFVVPDKMDIYARYEWFDVDGVAFKQSTVTTTATDNDVAQLLTVGSNYFLRGHATKFSVDVVYAFDGLPQSDTGAGLRASDGSSTTLRGQFMMSF